MQTSNLEEAELSPQRIACKRLAEALTGEGPEGATVRAIVAELKSAGIRSRMHVGQKPEFFQNNPEATAEWALGSALRTIEKWNTIEDWAQLFHTQSILNILNVVAETGTWP